MLHNEDLLFWYTLYKGCTQHSCSVNPCRVIGTNLQNIANAEITTNVHKWQYCKQLCTERDECKFWKWHNKDAGAWALKCYTMTSYSYSTTGDNNIVSGERDCKGNKRNTKKINKSFKIRF